MSIVDHGIPILTARQWTSLLSPNANNTDWNFIVEYWAGGVNLPVWTAVIKNFTTNPVVTQYSTLTHVYANTLYNVSIGKNGQIRALNGRIFIPQFANYTTYYDPITEDIYQIGPIVETPPIDPNASTILYSAKFDVAGLLYFGTQESQHRRAMITVTDTTTTPPAQSIIGYVPPTNTSNAYTTYAYRLAPDTVTATKWIYVAYGEDPWQLWALNITTGVASKLDEVPSNGNIDFADISGQGWVATLDTNLGQPSNVRTRYWCLDGAKYPYDTGAFTADNATEIFTKAANPFLTGTTVHVSTNGTLPGGLFSSTDYFTFPIDANTFYLATSHANALAGIHLSISSNGTGTQTITTVAPFGTVARNVTPASNPLISSPVIDPVGSGILNWRFGSSGPFTTVNYPVNDAAPTALEGLVASNDGLVCNGQQYLGFVKYVEPADTHTWFGPMAGISEGPRLNPNGIIFMAGYPNGVLWQYDPDAPWQPSDLVAPNPKLLGNYGLNGTQFAGIKYATFLADGPLAGSAGRLYCCGTRSRNGTGSGIGSWDKTTKAFAGTYAAPGMDQCLPTGMCVLGGISRVVMATRLLAGTGTALLFLFDYAMGFITSLPVMNNLASLGQIYETTTPNVITGIVQGANNQLGLWQYNVQTQTFLQYVELPIIGVLGAQCQRFGGSVWIMSGTNLVRVDVSALTASVVQSLASITPVIAMSFASDQSTLFMAGATNAGVVGAQMFSLSTGDVLAAGSMTGVGIIYDAVLSNSGSVVLIADSMPGTGILNAVAFLNENDLIPPDIGGNTVELTNNESTTILRCQPVFCNGDGTVQLAVADNSGSAIVAGLVADDVIASGSPGIIVVDGLVNASTDEWDVVCGTTGGLTFDVTYYLHPLLPGCLTATPPSASNQQVVPVIRALSPFSAVVFNKPPILINS